MIKQVSPKSKDVEVVLQPLPLDQCKEFLKTFLANGPISRTNVYRETENIGLSWEIMKQAFSGLNGREYVQRGEYFWRIMPD